MLLLRRGSILSARFHPPATILGHRVSSLVAKNAQFYWQGEPSRALIQTTRCNSNAAPLNAFYKHTATKQEYKLFRVETLS